mgnify:FL=1
MKRVFTLLALMGFVTITTMAKKTETITLRILATTDVHGAFFPYNFIERKPMQGSLARVSTYINEQRKNFGDKLILLENGDILQGQPTCYYTNYIKPELPNVAAQVVNYLKYDAATFGNHDVETGHAVYDKWIKEMNCPTLGANIIDKATGQPYVKPYTIIERDGVRVAVLGMLTPAIPNWLNEELWKGLSFEEMVSSCRKWVKVIREKEHADVIVGLFHSGWDGGISTSHYDEDATKKVAEQVDGFDVIFFGHDHRERAVTTNNGTVCLDASCNALRVAQATIKVTQQKGKTIKVEKNGEIIDVCPLEIDKDYMNHFQPQIDSVSAFVGRQIGTFRNTVRSRDAFFGSAGFTDYIHRLQLQHTGADISFNAPLTFDSEIKAGPIYVSDMFKIYRYENQIYTLRMTGAEVRKMLEMSYDLWVNTMTSPDDHIMLLTDTWTDKQRMGFKNLTFNFDTAAGIDYEVDVTKPNGQKVHILKFSDGRPFDEHAWYKVAMNSYRGNGGGELLTRGAGIAKEDIPSRIIYMSKHDQRYYLTQMIEKQGTVEALPLNNWRFVPEEWTKPAIERDRRLIFKED